MHTTPTSAIDMRRRERWYVGVRWFYVLGIGIPSISALAAAYGFQQQVVQDILLVCGILAINGGFLAFTYFDVRLLALHRAVAAVQIVFDLTLMGVAFYLNRGYETPLAVWFTIPIVMSAAFFGRRVTYATGLLAAGIFATLSLLDFTKILPVQHIAAPILHTDPQLFFPIVIAVVLIFLVITVITGLVGQLIREREQLAAAMVALGTRNALTEAILRTMGSALVAVDRDGLVTLVNDNFESLTGWKRTEVIGQPLDEVLPLLDDSGKRIGAAHRPMLEFINDNKATRTLTSRSLSGYNYKRKDGSNFPFVGNVAPIVVNSDVVGFTTVFDDATDLKKLDLLRDNFIALMSHQLKTPIGEINGYAYNLLGGVAGSLNPTLMNYTEAIQEQAARAGKLIADLLDIVLAGEGSLTVRNDPVDLKPVVDEVARLRRPQAEKKGLELKINCSNDLIYVRGDERKLVQAIGNLVDNAIRYTKAGAVTVSVVPSTDTVDVQVSDRGKGMDQATIDALFGKKAQLGPLVRTPTSEGGTGLGVYLAKQLVALMNGSIRVVGSSDEGTTIAVNLRRITTNQKHDKAVQSK